MTMVFRMIHVENSRILPMDKVLSLGFTGICKTYLDGIFLDLPPPSNSGKWRFIGISY